jgi:hypothetical protein
VSTRPWDRIQRRLKRRTPPATAAIAGNGPERASDRRNSAVLVVVSAVAWLLFSSAWAFLPIRWLVTLVHESGHALAAELVGGDVKTVTINSRGGGLTTWTFTDESTTRRLIVASGGYVGAAVIGGFMVEAAARVRRGRVAAFSLAAAIAAIGLAWVPWRFSPPVQAGFTGSGPGDGRFTTLFCVAAAAAFAALAIQPFAGVRRLVIVALGVALCFASVDDLRGVLEISSRGGHSDAATAASITPLSSWMWSAIWLTIGLVACGAGLWSAVSRDGRRRRSDRAPR